MGRVRHCALGFDGMMGLVYVCVFACHISRIWIGLNCCSFGCGTLAAVGHGFDTHFFSWLGHQPNSVMSNARDVTVKGYPNGLDMVQQWAVGEDNV